MSNLFINERQAKLYELWGEENDYYPETLKWRDTLSVLEKKLVERWECLHDNWCEESNDPETEEWRNDLTEGEKWMVYAWDTGYAHSIGVIAKEIVALEEKNKPSVVTRLEAAKQQIAERKESVPPREHVQSRSAGHDR